MRRLLAALIALTLSSTLPGAARPGAALSQRQSAYAVVLILDGARPDYFNLAPMRHLRSLQRAGMTYTNAFVGQEPANTPPSHATIGTGVFPRRHGIQGFWWKDPRTGSMTRPTDLDAVQRGALEDVLARHHVPSIAATVKARSRRGGVLAISGHKCYAADALGGPSADYILCSMIYHDRWVAQAVGRHRPPPGAVNNPRWDVPIPPPTSGFGPAVQQWRVGSENDWTVKYALWAFRRIHFPRVLMINLPETDVTGHFAGNRTWVMKRLMRHFDAELGSLLAAYRAAGILSRTTWIVTADHGMSRVQDRLPFSVLDRAIDMAGATKVYMEADTAASIGIREVAKARQVAINVALLGGKDIDATYYKTFQQGQWTYRAAYVAPALPYRLTQAYRTLANTAAAPEGPDVLAVYAPHVTTGNRPVGPYDWLAGHLGPGWDEQHIPLIISGAGIRRGTSRYPARLVDIAPTLEHVLEVPVGPVDGAVLSDALLHPVRGGLRAQGQRQARLLPLVRALRQRSGYQ